MPVLVTEQGPIHYEYYGRGRPVILLHGWLGSWALWRDTILYLSREFRTYALDFFGFGDLNAPFERSASAVYSVDNYIELVNQFMDRLGIIKAPLVGHSMGGTVSLGMAARYPEKVVKVAIIGSPINGSSLNPFLKLSGYKQIAHLVYTIPYVLNTFIYMLTYVSARDGRTLYRMVSEDASKVASIDAFFQSIGTLRQANMLPLLGDLKMPILGIYGKRDVIVNPRQSKVLLQHAPTSTEAWFENSGHFPMMDEPERFHLTVTDFLKNG